MASRALTPLTNQEIEELYNEFDHDRDGKVSFEDVEATLRKVLEELSPEPLRHHLSHPERSTSRVKRWTRSLKVWDNGTEQKSDIETRDPNDSDMHDFLCRLLPGCEDLMTKTEFCKHVQTWNIPSQDQPCTQDEIQQARKYDRKLPLRRRWAAWLSVHGPEVAFMAVMIAIIIACSLWQGLKYALNRRARAAFSAGLVVAKFFAGAIYPTFFFMMLSMSRWFATFCRKSYLVSRFINWDLSQTFHIRMSCLALLLSLGHTIAHLSGTFVYGSSSERKQKQRLQKFLRANYVRRSYSDFL